MYTWGQIRLLLQQSFPGVSLDTIDEKINSRYALILSLLDWKGLEKSGTIETVAAIDTGTVTLTNGSEAVSGAGTNWTSAITGMQLELPDRPELYTVTFVDATALVLDRPFEGPTSPSGGGGYTLLQSIYALPKDCRNLRVITNPVTGRELIQKSELGFAEQIGFPRMEGVAEMYIPQPDLIDPNTGFVLAQQIRLYPLPRLARGYPIVYEQMAPGFDGANTSLGPLQFVSDAALLAGCKADLELEKETPNMAKVQGYEAGFQKQFTGMLHVENDKRPSVPLRMHPAYTRHRAVRLLRNYGGSILLDGEWHG